MLNDKLVIRQHVNVQDEQLQGRAKTRTSPVIEDIFHGHRRDTRLCKDVSVVHTSTECSGNVEVAKKSAFMCCLAVQLRCLAAAADQRRNGVDMLRLGKTKKNA